jgi:hypothetical protein
MMNHARTPDAMATKPGRKIQSMVSMGLMLSGRGKKR